MQLDIVKMTPASLMTAGSVIFQALTHCCLAHSLLQHLLPLLGRPDSWDVLIAHYLGVDHAGHTHGVNSRQMEAKLAQMDDQVSTVIGETRHSNSMHNPGLDRAGLSSTELCGLQLWNLGLKLELNFPMLQLFTVSNC